MSTHTFLVAIEVSSQNMTREQAEQAIARRLPRPGMTVGVEHTGPLGMLEAWWIAEDDRTDGSDNDSAVFVTPGNQKAAYAILRDRGLTEECNDPERGGRVLDNVFEGTNTD